MISNALLENYAEARKNKQAADAASKDANGKLADAERDLMDAMAEQDVQSVGTDKFSVSVNRTLRVQAPGDKAAAAERLAADPNFAGFVKRDFNLNTLSSYVREIAADKPDTDPIDLLPPEVRDDLTVFEHYRLNFRSK